MQTPLQAILFDHDGTLVDSEAIHLGLWRQIVAPFGIQISDQDYWEQMLGVPMEQSAQDLIARYALEVPAPVLVAAKQAANEHFLATRYFPQMAHASRWLQYFSQRTRLALVSGSTRHCVETSLQGHGWQGLFAQVISGNDVRRNKPHPDGYIKALEQLQIPASAGIAVEDTEVGIQAAHDAGLRVIAIRDPRVQGQTFALAEQVFDSLDNACQWLDAQLPG